MTAPVRPDPLTVRAARWSARHPWRAIGAWLVLVVACLAAGQAFSLKQIGNRDATVGQSHQAQLVLHRAGLDQPAVENVLISGGDSAGRQAAAGELTRSLRGQATVASVAPALPSSHTDALLVAVTMRGDPDTASDRVEPILAATAATQRAHPGLRVEQAGSASADVQINDQVARDLSRAAAISLPVTLIILLIAFGAIVVAGVPVLLAMSAVAAATGLSVLASQFLPDSGSTSSMILLMGMAVGVDYSLFYLRRIREEGGRGRAAAIEIAARTSGHSVVVSGLAVIVSMAGLYLADNVVFSSLATGAILVVLIAVVGSITVLPALLAKLGRAVDRPRVPLLWRLSEPGRPARVWPRLLRPALRRPVRTLLSASGVLVLLALPATRLRLHSDSAASLPRSIPIVGTMNRLEQAFPGQQVTDILVVQARADQAAQVRAALESIPARLAGNPLFAPGSSPVTASADGRVHQLSLAVPWDAESGPAKQGVKLLRQQLGPQLRRLVPGSRWLVAGDVAVAVDVDQHLADRLPWVIGFVVGLTMLIMLITLRSVVLAALTAVLNLLSAGAAFGVLVLVFQHSWLQGALNFQSTGALINWIPLFTFAVLFGLSMDYHIFLLSRIREAAQAGYPMPAAVRAGVVSSAGTITSAAIVMVSVFSIFVSLHMVEMKELGLGLAVAVLVDAIVVRTVLLPAALVALGHWAWWPGPLSRTGQLRPERDRRPSAVVG